MNGVIVTAGPPARRKPGDALSFSFSLLPLLSPPFHHTLLFRPKCTLNTFPFPSPLAKLPAALTLLLLPSLTSPRAPATRHQQAFPGAQDAFPDPQPGEPDVGLRTLTPVAEPL